MGCYVNTADIPKEVWLALNGRPVHPSETKLTEAEVPVCLVNNGFFLAAGVAFSEQERKVFIEEDGREKQWFMVPRSKLYGVSDLKNWEPKTR